MSADFGTEITVEGNTEELLAILKVLRMFETENDKVCISLNYINGTNPHILLDEETKEFLDEETEEFLKAAHGKLEVEAAGPYGKFLALSEVGLFEALADTAPGAKFSGRSSGSNTGTNYLSLDAELKDNKLFLSESDVPNDDLVPEAYFSNVVEKLPYDKFCELFKVDKSEFDEGSYQDFVADIASEYGFFNNDSEFFGLDYDDFMSWCEASTIEPEEYLQVIKELLKELQLGYATFQASFDYDEYVENNYVENWIYDPIKKIRIQ